MPIIYIVLIGASSFATSPLPPASIYCFFIFSDAALTLFLNSLRFRSASLRFYAKIIPFIFPLRATYKLAFQHHIPIQRK